MIARKTQEVLTFVSVDYMIVMDIRDTKIKVANDIMENGVNVIHGIVSRRTEIMPFLMARLNIFIDILREVIWNAPKGMWKMIDVIAFA